MTYNSVVEICKHRSKQVFNEFLKEQKLNDLSLSSTPPLKVRGGDRGSPQFNANQREGYGGGG